DRRSTADGGSDEAGREPGNESQDLLLPGWTHGLASPPTDGAIGANVQAILGGDTRLEAGPAQQLDRDGVEDPAGAALDDARVDRLAGAVQVVADGDEFAVLPAPSLVRQVPSRHPAIGDHVFHAGRYRLRRGLLGVGRGAP